MRSLDQIFTAAEAAERLRLTRRAVIKLGRNLGACSRFGRDIYLFSESDILTIWHALRAEPVARSGRATLAPLRSEDLAYERLLARVTEKRRKRKR